MATEESYIEEITALKDRIEELENLDAQAATYVESVICIESQRFTAEPPYVGWKGLGLALQQDYDELKELREEIRNRKKFGVFVGFLMGFAVAICTAIVLAMVVF